MQHFCNHGYIFKDVFHEYFLMRNVSFYDLGCYNVKDQFSFYLKSLA